MRWTFESQNRPSLFSGLRNVSNTAMLSGSNLAWWNMADGRTVDRQTADLPITSWYWLLFCTWAALLYRTTEQSNHSLLNKHWLHASVTMQFCSRLRMESKLHVLNVFDFFKHAVTYNKIWINSCNFFCQMLVEKCLPCQWRGDFQSEYLG